jgi:hypothetical protein
MIGDHHGRTAWRATLPVRVVDDIVGTYRKNKPESQKEANRAHAKLRAPGERANAQLKTWRVLRKLRCCPWRAGQLAKAIHVLQIRESNAG